MPIVSHQTLPLSYPLPSAYSTPCAFLPPCPLYYPRTQADRLSSNLSKISQLPTHLVTLCYPLTHPLSSISHSQPLTHPLIYLPPLSLIIQVDRLSSNPSKTSQRPTPSSNPRKKCFITRNWYDTNCHILSIHPFYAQSRYILSMHPLNAPSEYTFSTHYLLHH